MTKIELTAKTKIKIYKILVETACFQLKVDLISSTKSYKRLIQITADK